LSKNDVLFNDTVTSELFCGELCLREFSCTGFNYMATGNRSDVNCQITGGSYTNMDVMGGGATNWEFHESVLVCNKYTLLYELVNSQTRLNR
jgi:hypothetical protein